MLTFSFNLKVFTFILDEHWTLFKQDSDPKHTHKATKECLHPPDEQSIPFYTK